MSVLCSTKEIPWTPLEASFAQQCTIHGIVEFLNWIDRMDSAGYVVLITN